MKKISRGFTLLEMVVVLCIIAALALFAVPSYQGKMVSEQIAEAVKLANLAKSPVASMWSSTKMFPANNAEASLPASDKIVSNFISDIAILDGAINVTFGNRANGLIKGKILTLRPAVIEDAQIVPVAWVCGNAPVPDKMTVHGVNKTNIAATYLPLSCR